MRLDLRVLTSGECAVVGMKLAATCRWTSAPKRDGFRRQALVLAAAAMAACIQPADARQQAGQAQQQQTQEQAQPQQQQAQQQRRQSQQAPGACGALPAHQQLTDVLSQIVSPGDPGANGGLGNPMWAVLVDRGGNICVVTRSGESVGDQWLGSRAIAASKAYTANGFSLSGFSLSTANLYWPTQPENSLYGSPNANPIDVAALYAGDASSWGTTEDPLTGRRIGGTIAFGGGLALYNGQGELVGALGISGDESCTDHVVAWKVRHELNLDNVPDGVTKSGTDNIIHDLTTDPSSGRQKSSSGYGHPTCSARAKTIAENFTETAPTGPEE